MENEPQTKNDDEKKNNNKMPILTTKAKNVLINLISYLLENKDSFDIKLTPKDLELVLDTDSEMSLINQFLYSMHINYISFNKKRDTKKSIKLYKRLPSEIEMSDEYYESRNIFKKIVCDFFPTLRKGMTLDLSDFTFFQLSKDDRSCFTKYDMKKKISSNKLVLVVYFLDIGDLTKNENLIKDLEKMENIWEFFENIYVICQTKNFPVDNFDIKNEEGKIIYLKNVLSYYESDNENLFNIFNTKNKLYNNNKGSYFFILNDKNVVIKLKEINELKQTVLYLLINLNESKKKGQNLFQKKLGKRREKLKAMEDIITFIKKLKKLDYFFYLSFYFSINLSISNDFSNIELKRIQSVRIIGEFMKKEFLYLRELFQHIKQPKCEFNVIEIPTVNINIDFTEMKCLNCSGIIKEDEFFYYCYICKTKYCSKCVDVQLQKEGREKYIDPNHNLLFFKTRNKENLMNIEKIRLGNNRFTKYNQNNKFDTKHKSICNGCKTNFEGTQRYICLKCKNGKLNCRELINYCGKCIKKMCENKDEMVKLEKESIGYCTNPDNSNTFIRGQKIYINHSHEEHIYLLIPLEIKEDIDNLCNY